MKTILLVLLPVLFICSTISHYPQPYINLDKSEIEVKDDVIKVTNLKYIIGPFTYGEFDNVTEKVLFQNPEYDFLVHPIIETTTYNFLIFKEVEEKVTTKLGKLKDSNTLYYQKRYYKKRKEEIKKYRKDHPRIEGVNKL